MNTLFVPYHLTLRLNALGFKTLLSLGLYLNDPNEGLGIKEGHFYYNKPIDSLPDRKLITAPLWRQAFDWFETQHNLTWEHTFNDSQLQLYVGEITYPDNSLEFFKNIEVNYGEYTKAFHIAEQECLEQLIKIVENRK